MEAKLMIAAAESAEEVDAISESVLEHFPAPVPAAAAMDVDEGIAVPTAAALILTKEELQERFASQLGYPPTPGVQQIDSPRSVDRHL